MSSEFLMLKTKPAAMTNCSSISERTSRAIHRTMMRLRKSRQEHHFLTAVLLTPMRTARFTRFFFHTVYYSCISSLPFVNRGRLFFSMSVFALEMVKPAVSYRKLCRSICSTVLRKAYPAILTSASHISALRSSAIQIATTCRRMTLLAHHLRTAARQTPRRIASSFCEIRFS